LPSICSNSTAAASALIDDLIDDANYNLTSGYINHGRGVVFDPNGDDLHALQRSEIQRVTIACLSMDALSRKRTRSQNTIFHSNCRGIWVAILKDEEELPAIGGIPQSLRDRFGDAVNDLMQPRNPVIRKSSQARKEADRRCASGGDKRKLAATFWWRCRAMTSRLDEAVKRIINVLFLPLEFTRPTLFAWPTLIATVIFLLATATFAAPPLREIIADTIFDVRCLTAVEKEHGKEYCDFAAILLQVLMALTIGGVFVTERIAGFTEIAIQAYHDNAERELSDERAAIMNNLYRAYAGVKQALYGITIWNVPRKLLTSLISMILIILVVFRLPMFYIGVLIFKIMSDFPKGLYGVFALVLFESFLLSQVAKTYFDYLPVCYVIPTAAF
jgi:hypothetical protein